MGDRPKNPELWAAHYAKEKARDAARHAKRYVKRPRSPRPTLPPEVRAAREKARKERQKERYRTDPEYREKVKAQANARNKRLGTVKQNPEAQRKHHLRRNYGITVDEYQGMLEAQKGVCAICFGVNAGGQRLSVDHCHTTLAVRALLCSPCNTSVGLMQEDPTRMRSAAAYIELHKGA